MTLRLLSPSNITVAKAGLGVLPDTRLNVACKLLMAERITVTVIAWGANDADLLVADTATTEGDRAIKQAAARGMPTLRLARTPDASTHTLSPTATVRDIAVALRQLIDSAQTETAPPEIPLPPMLEALRLDLPSDVEPTLFELGQHHIVVDRPRGCVHLLHSGTMKGLLRDIASTHWRSRTLGGDWSPQSPARDHTVISIESIWWHLLPMPHVKLPRRWVGSAAQLSAWPELAIEAVDATTLAALTQLMYRSWRPDQLAAVSGVSPAHAERIVAITHASGLAGKTSTVVPTAARTGLKDAVMKIARRFGLNLLGARHA